MLLSWGYCLQGHLPAEAVHIMIRGKVMKRHVIHLFALVQARTDDLTEDWRYRHETERPKKKDLKNNNVIITQARTTLRQHGL